MVIDLTRPMDRDLAIYAEEGYSDPPFECVEWCSVASRGFRVSALRLGTQTGTHIDAPAHFDAAGATLDALPVERLIGRYYTIDLPDRAGAAELGAMAAPFAGESILFLRAPAGGAARVESSGLDALLGLPPRVWAVDGAVEVEERPALEFHRRLAAAGVYLIEDLLREAARSVGPGGEMISLPLALTGTSGAPCRVIVRGAGGTPTQVGARGGGSPAPGGGGGRILPSRAGRSRERELLVAGTMEKPTPALEPIDPSSLEAASGGMRYDENSRESTNVLDCRGPTCLDSNGQVDVEATRQHKLGIGHRRIPLPKGDGGGLGLPPIPDKLPPTRR